jgi:site-specific DNA-methyltransferase (adenine-specific)
MNIISKTYNIDCLEFMKTLQDNAFDLAIVDPPYGIGKDWQKRNKGATFADTTYTNNCIPDKNYFKELFRVSKNQIIWGYNYFTDILGSTNYIIVWDKQSNNNQVFKYSKCEIAFTSIHIPANLVSIPWDGYRMGKETGHKKIHPHQKPIALYEWLLQYYAKNGDRILDTHLGSGSSRIACYNKGFDFVGCEIDKTYFDLQEERFRNECFGEIKTNNGTYVEQYLFK